MIPAKTEKPKKKKTKKLNEFNTKNKKLFFDFEKLFLDQKKILTFFFFSKKKKITFLPNVQTQTKRKNDPKILRSYITKNVFTRPRLLAD